jgi:probable DNA metabolism protein
MFMLTYCYDGSTEGLFSAISHILRHEPDPGAAVLRKQGYSLFEEGIFIQADSKRADEMIRRFSSAYPRNARDVLYCVYAEQDGIETSLLHYIHLVARHGSGISGHLTHPAVSDIRHLSGKVAREVHRFKGLMRFSMLEDGSYLARMEPDFNIIHPLSLFFSNRLQAQNWFICDVHRSLVSRWDGKSLDFGTIESFIVPELSAQEREVQALWRTFFRHVSIPERRNERCQKSFMPIKYWKYLVEKQ